MNSLQSDFISRNSLVWKVSNRMSSDRAAIRLRQLLCITVQFGSCDVEMLVEVLRAFDEHLADVIAQFP